MNQFLKKQNASSKRRLVGNSTIEAMPSERGNHKSIYERQTDNMTIDGNDIDSVMTNEDLNPNQNYKSLQKLHKRVNSNANSQKTLPKLKKVIQAELGTAQKPTKLPDLN